MYENHFGLKCKPFALSPDPRFLYHKASHREALAALIYGVHERCGLMTMVGEVGTGKTTLIHALLKLFRHSVNAVLIRHSTLNRKELLAVILYQVMELNESSAKLTRVEMLQRLWNFVSRERKARRPPPVLIIDEAQNLSPGVLEEIRLLTNLEDPEQKLLQIILVGQPELDKKIQSTKLRALRQRIAVYARLEPYTLEETYGYIGFRLRTAGYPGETLFTDEALKAIWKASGGYPRAINILCEQGLVNAFGAGEQKVDAFTAAEAIRDAGHVSLTDVLTFKPETLETMPHLHISTDRRSG
jgi:general secretion pathway protein A